LPKGATITVPELLKINLRNQVRLSAAYYSPNEGGWLYLITVIDLFSRKVVGWSMASIMKADLVNQALLMAIWQRKPAKGLV
jgi:transposase InsO family protein